MTTRAEFSEPCSARGSEAPPAEDPWADAAKRVREGVARHPYLAVAAAGGVGCFLAGGLALRLLPGLLRVGVRVAVASALPTLVQVARAVASPER